MNVRLLSDCIRNNEDAAERILEALGFYDVRFAPSRNELRFPRLEGHNPTSCSLQLETLRYTCFSTGDHGDIYSLIMRQRGVSFPEALNFTAAVLGIDKSKLNVETKAPFGGFFKKYARENRGEQSSENISIYDESILSKWSGKYNTMFVKDGIDLGTQAKFGIGYDIDTNRITIPEYTVEGELCGVMGRLNDAVCEKGDRWLPLVRCPRSLTLYGYHRNYLAIQNKDLCVIGESEKFPQQLNSFGSQIGLATCGCNISKTQARHIKSLFIKRIVLAYDEGLEEDQIRAEAEKLKIDNDVFKNQVGYVFDRSNEVIPKGSKGSPSDYGPQKFRHLIKHCTVWI